VTTPDPNDSDSSASDPELNALVTECLERFERDGMAAVDDLCSRNPALEGKLRRRVGMLRRDGAVDGPKAPRPKRRSRSASASSGCCGGSAVAEWAWCSSPSNRP
jgi:hypothetical protein